jgi:hypothetical protein
MITGQEPRLLEGQPALGLEGGTLRAGAMATRVVPDMGDMAVRTRLHMAPERRRPALHDGARGFPDMGRERVSLLVGWKGIVEDRLERDERHRCLRTRGIRPSSDCFIQYHANYLRDKRLVQPLIHVPFCPDKALLVRFYGIFARCLLSALASRHDNEDVICLTRRAVNNPNPSMKSEGVVL